MRLRYLSATCLLVLTLPAAIFAQGIERPAELYARPGSGKLATIAKGTVLTPGQNSGEYTLVHLHGFIYTDLLGYARDSFPATVSSGDARLRQGASTSTDVIADLEKGMGFHVVSKQGNWSEVDRAGWIRRAVIPASVRASAPPAPSATPPAAPPTSSGTADSDARGTAEGAVTPAKAAALSPAPGVAPVATVKGGAVLTPLARDRGWVRVRLEGWVKEDDLVAADTTMTSLSAADLKVSPDKYVGRVVRWNVTALAFQTADPLRKDMRPNEPYILARGPGGENALLYLALPPSLVEVARNLAPMATIVITAKVRTGRADPSGVPILDVQTLTTR